MVGLPEMPEGEEEAAVINRKMGTKSLRVEEYYFTGRGERKSGRRE